MFLCAIPVHITRDVKLRLIAQVIIKIHAGAHKDYIRCLNILYFRDRDI
jgi:hypothetical protein